MEPEMIRISRPLVEKLIMQLDESATYCEKARFLTKYELYHTKTEPTESVIGANGFARATMRDILQTLESHLN
tara:strand:- start:61 stop:279 length:219 start_codon:yes stop_codon:yes gene_type:complete